MNIQAHIQQPPAKDGDFQGYAEHLFLEAFEQLCRENGGYWNGRKAAERLIREHVK